MNLGPFLVVQNSKCSMTTLFSCFCNRIRLVVGVRIIGGGLPVLPGTASSFELASVPEASVSMSAALRGAKTFRVTTSFGGMFKAGDVSFCTAAFFEVPVISSVARFFRLRTFWKPSSCIVCCSVGFSRIICPASVVALSTALSLVTLLYTCRIRH
jgi:hypothetical protein